MTITDLLSETPIQSKGKIIAKQFGIYSGKNRAKHVEIHVKSHNEEQAKQNVMQNT